MRQCVSHRHHHRRLLAGGPGDQLEKKMRNLTIVAALLATVCGAQADDLKLKERQGEKVPGPSVERKKELDLEEYRKQQERPTPTTCAIAEYCLGPDGKWKSNRD